MLCLTWVSRKFEYQNTNYETNRSYAVSIVGKIRPMQSPPGSQALAWKPVYEKLLLLVFRVLTNELGNMVNVHLPSSRSRSFSKTRSQAGS